MVALTGIEPDGWQFRRVQIGLSGCVSIQLVFEDAPEHRHEPPTSQRSHSAVVDRRERATSAALTSGTPRREQGAVEFKYEAARDAGARRDRHARCGVPFHSWLHLPGTHGGRGPG